MSETMLAALSNIRTVEEMIVAFRDEEHCRRLLETMVWPEGRMLRLWVQTLDRDSRRASVVHGRVSINAPAAIPGFSSR